ncbi:MAG: hypothetical protein ACHQ2F_08560 [Desulfobaccales bacterium]
MLKDHIKEIRERIRAGLFTNEAAVSQGVVCRILGALSWPIYDTQVVSPEYPVNGRRIDFALCHPPWKPLVFIEVKQVGQSDIGERQLFEYAFHKGVPMAILTDGREWHFFLPAEQGDYGERRVYKLDIIERDIEEIVRRLERYLKYETICSGKAVENARADYKDVARNRLIKNTLHQAWAKIIEEEDELLLELVAEGVESLCGYKPDPDTVAAFLKTNVLFQAPAKKEITPISSSSSFTTQIPMPQDILAKGAAHNIGFSLDGKRYPARNARDVLINVFKKLAERDPNFLERFANLPKHGSKRRFLARSIRELYPHRPDLARDHSHELGNGWWLVVHLSKKAIEKIIKMACEVAGLRYGTDLIINLGA